MRALTNERAMPRGLCSGCGERAVLPPFGAGHCFLCATDGPPGERTPTIGARQEDWTPSVDLFDEPSDAEEQRAAEVLEEFRSHQDGHARAVLREHYRSQRFTEWRAASYERRAAVSPELGPTVAQLRARLAKRARIAALEARPAQHARDVAVTKLARNGSGNYAPEEKVAAVHRLREQGLSLRLIAKATGLDRETVRAYAKRIDRPEALRLTHIRWKSEGRPMVPPWQRAS